MPSTKHTAKPEDDLRHTPGLESLPLWNESFWFPFYDPTTTIGVVLRAGIVANQNRANLFLTITKGGTIVHSFVDMNAPLPALEKGRMAVCGLTLEWTPLEKFHLTYRSGTHALDLTWTGVTPVYKYPHPEDVSYDVMTGHIEHAGRVTGTVSLAGEQYAINCLAHRDHSWGGERDWDKFYRWNYLSGEIDEKFWFNAVRIKFFAEMPWLYIGCLWDGTELHAVEQIEMTVQTTDGDRRQVSVDVKLTDERNQVHHVIGEEVLVIVPVLYGRTWLKDGITRYRYGDRVGYGILEHGYVEDELPFE